MTAKSNSATSNKPSPSERLARKREAARLRQQRCRARKRHAVMETNRQTNGASSVGSSSTQDSKAKEGKHASLLKGSPFRTKEVPLSPPRHSIFKIVSFDSPVSSHVEPLRRRPPPSIQVISRSSSEESLSTPVKQPPSEGLKEEKSDEQLVQQEELAVAAMLSLKSADVGVPEATAGEHVPSVAPAKKEAKVHPFECYYRDWDGYHPPYAYTSRNAPAPPHYRTAMLPSRFLFPHYSYYPNHNARFTRYGRD